MTLLTTIAIVSNDDVLVFDRESKIMVRFGETTCCADAERMEEAAKVECIRAVAAEAEWR